MSDLQVDRYERTTVFTINRPERMNALSGAVFAELTEGMREFTDDPDQYVAIITAAGDKAFSAGADLKEMAEGAAQGTRLPVSRQPDVAGVAACPKPVIAAVNGLAVAAGLELALCCDIRLSVPDAWFGAFEVKRGILAGIAVNVLPRLLPYGEAADMLLAGTRMSAERAHAVGLVQQLVPRDRLLEVALERAGAIASHSQPAVWGSKQVLNYWRGLQLSEQQAYYEAVAHRVMLSGDVLEGPRAFAEKREPQFSNRWPTLPGF
ncbi:MAG: enoyl-CoA hydratase-related protein [Microbacterium sp.]